jgi:transposase
MSPELEALYASGGRPSIAPEYLLRAQLIQILYACRRSTNRVALRTTKRVA